MIARPWRAWGILALAFFALGLLPGSVRADEKEGEAFTLDLLPSDGKAREEWLDYQVALQLAKRPDPRAGSVRATVRRQVAASSSKNPRESLRFDSIDVPDLDVSSEEGAEPVYQVVRDPITRRAAFDPRSPAPSGNLAIGYCYAPELMPALLRDPDGLARVLSTEASVKPDQEWSVDAKALAALLAPEKARLADSPASRATARLEHARSKGGKLEVKLSLRASLYLRLAEDPGSVAHFTIRGELEGTGDGSAAPTREHVATALRREDDSKEATSVELTRSLAPRASVEEQDADRGPYADAVLLKNGRRLRGRIMLHNPERIIVRANAGVMSVSRSEVAAIELAAAPMTVKPPVADRSSAATEEDLEKLRASVNELEQTIRSRDTRRAPEMTTPPPRLEVPAAICLGLLGLLVTAVSLTTFARYLRARWLLLQAAPSFVEERLRSGAAPGDALSEWSFVAAPLLRWPNELLALALLELALGASGLASRSNQAAVEAGSGAAAIAILAFLALSALLARLGKKARERILSVRNGFRPGP